MPSIRDLVGAIRQRDGVEAAVVLGRVGRLIDLLAAKARLSLTKRRHGA